MSRIEDLITVLDLACLTESRSDGEQRALLRVARWVDQQANRNTAQNRWMWGEHAGHETAERQRPMVCMEQQVEATRDLDPENGEHEVHLSKRLGRKVEDTVPL